MSNKYSQGLRDEIEKCLEHDELLADLEFPFAAAGTLDDYLKIRDKFPDQDFPAYSLVWDPLEWIQNLDAVLEIGVTERDFIRAFEGEASSMDAICLHILRREHEFEQTPDKSHPVGRKLKESDATINFLVAGLHEACMHYGVRPPGSLMYLTSYRLCGQNSTAKKRSAFRRFAHQVYSTFIPILPGVEAPIDPADLSFGKIAKELGVPTSTISRAWPRLLRAWQLSELISSEAGEHFEPPIDNKDWRRGFHL